MVSDADIDKKVVPEKFKTFASDSAYIMQCHHYIAIKAIDRQRHV